MARTARAKIDESNLSKGHLRKLNALRKSLGDDIAEKAFLEWYEEYGETSFGPADKNASLIAEAVWNLVEKRNLRIPRQGYLVTRGRGRVIVELGGAD